jgi:hypothetical protein
VADLRIPHATIRRIVDDMRIGRTEPDIRADIRSRCDSPRWTPELIAKAEDYVVGYYRRMTEAARG